MSEEVDYWDWLMRYGMRSREQAVLAYDVALPKWPAVPPYHPLRDQVRAARAGARRLAEAEDRQAWIGQVKRRLGLVTEVHRCWVYGGDDGSMWAWICQREGCGISNYGYRWQWQALARALAHTRSFLPEPPEETPVTELDWAAYMTMADGIPAIGKVDILAGE